MIECLRRPLVYSNPNTALPVLSFGLQKMQHNSEDRENKQAQKKRRQNDEPCAPVHVLAMVVTKGQPIEYQNRPRLLGPSNVTSGLRLFVVLWPSICSSPGPSVTLLHFAETFFLSNQVLRSVRFLTGTLTQSLVGQ